MALLSDFRTEISGGERRLRFQTIMTNEGAGPLEVRGQRGALSEPHLRTEQAIYDTDGGVRLVDNRALMEYASDGHDHWHIQGVMLYQLWSDDGATKRGTKVGFCFLDSVRMFGSTPRTYTMPMCGDRGDMSIRMGLSVGWGDDYPANFAFQWIDISALTPGDYTVQARADEQNWYVESDENNNCAWARITIASTDGPVAVHAQGRDCVAPPASTARVEGQYGTNRYETSAAASEDAFAPGVPVAYVTTGRNFPDALAAGAAAGFQGGPIILVDSNFVPILAVTELERLNPQRIVMVGGPAIVTDYVATLVARYQTGGGFTRIFGEDRYATAAAISANTFAPGVSTAYVTTGENWPDALAAVPHLPAPAGHCSSRADRPSLVRSRPSSSGSTRAASSWSADPASSRMRSWPRSTRTTRGVACSASVAWIATRLLPCCRPSTIRPVPPSRTWRPARTSPTRSAPGPRRPSAARRRSSSSRRRSRPRAAGSSIGSIQRGSSSSAGPRSSRGRSMRRSGSSSPDEAAFGRVGVRRRSLVLLGRLTASGPCGTMLA
jgi:hypothetical protein